MATAAAAEKTAEELRKEIDELHRQQREITDRLRDPRGLRRANGAPRPNGPGVGPVPRLRGFVRPAPVPEDQPAPKKRLLSAVVKVDNGEAKSETLDAAKEQDLVVEGKPVPVAAETNSARPRAFIPPVNGGAVRNDSYTRRRSEFDLPLPEPLPRVLPKDEDASVVKRNQRMFGQILGTLQVDNGDAKSETLDAAKEQDLVVEGKPVPVAAETNSARPRAFIPPANGGAVRNDSYTRRRSEFDLPLPEPLPRVLPKDEDASVVKRNQRMFGQILGTLQKFQQEDQKLATTEAFMRRSDSLRRAELKAREETEMLRQQEREQIAEKRRRDLTLRARVAAKAEEKKLELLFISWAEHHKKLSNFLRTKTQPPIYYMPVKPLVNDSAVIEQRKEQAFLEWKASRRAELSDYQSQIAEQYMANVEVELQRWQNGRNARRVNNVVNLQETMDKELETHRLEHGPKTRRIPGSNDEEEDVEDIVAEDELIDEVLDVTKLAEAPGNDSPNLAAERH